MRQLAADFDAIFAGKRRIEVVDRDATFARSQRGIEIADKVAAKPGLLQLDSELGVAQFRGVGQDFLREQIKHLGGRWALAGVPGRSTEQRIEIDPAGLECCVSLDVLGKVEVEPSLHDLRATLGVDGKIEVGELGVFERCLEGPLQLEERGGVAGRCGSLPLFLIARRGVGVGLSTGLQQSALATRTMMVPS